MKVDAPEPRGGPLRPVGFFREMDDASGSEPSLADSLGGLDPELKERVVRYLRGGAVLLAYFNLSEDVLDDARPPIGPAEIRTDGEWVWPSDLAYYVERYGVDLPGEFKEHLATMRWQAPGEGQLDMRVLATRAGFGDPSENAGDDV